MRSRRIITSAIVCIAALLAVIPAAASANSLLSGYGGPGQGSQVILGASLVNGPRGGGGSQGGGGSPGGGSQTGGGSTVTRESSTVATPSSAGRASSQGTASHTVYHKHAGAGAGHAKHVKAVAVGGSASGAAAHAASPAVAAVRPAAEGSDTLGVSGIDLLYILLAVGALVLTGVLTKRIASTSVSAGGAGS